MIVNAIMHMGAVLFIERPARNKQISEFIPALQSSAEAITGRIIKARENVRNHAQVTHIIGIERWCQQRLKVALGEPLVEGEYDPYRPPEDTPWEALKDEFEATRQQSIELVEALAERADPNMPIPHNQYGELTVNGWLQYLDLHASMTSRLIRQE